MPAVHAPIGVALVGFGFAGRTFHAPFITTTPGLALRVVASSQPDLVRQHYPHARVVVSPADAWRQDDVDLVVLATPNDSHAALAAAALRANRHVVVDKPFTVTLDQARQVIETARETGRLLSVYQNRRWDSDFQAVRHALDRKAIGDVVECRSEIARWRPQVRDRWRERPGPGAGLWYDLGPHLVDQALVLFGMPDSVTASLRVQRAGGATIDWFRVHLAYPRHDVMLTSSMLAGDAPARFLVRGTDGALVKPGGDVQERELMAGRRPGAADWGRDPDPLRLLREGEPPQSLLVPAGNYGAFYAAMRDAVSGTAPAPVTPADAWCVMALIDAALRSSDERRTVALEVADPPS